jgi:hypothetical protein
MTQTWRMKVNAFRERMSDIKAHRLILDTYE